jgi:hypothetical protein
MKDYFKLDEAVFNFAKADIVTDKHEDTIFFNPYGEHTKELKAALKAAGFKTFLDWNGYVRVQELLKAKRVIVKELYNEAPELAAGVFVALCNYYRDEMAADEEEKKHDFDYHAMFNRYVSEYL